MPQQETTNRAQIDLSVLLSEDDILKQFDKNGDGALSKDEWKDLVSEWCKANQKKMATLGSLM